MLKVQEKEKIMVGYDKRPDCKTRKEWLEVQAQLLEESRRSSQKSQESFDRCDTDGFVSQWCHDKSSDLARTLATIAQGEGMSTFHGLYLGERRVQAKYFTNQFGTSWMIREQDRHLVGGRAFIPCGKRSRIQKQFGLTERLETAPAWARFGGSGRGLSGLATVHVQVYRTGDQWGTDATLCPEED